jgi:uncharacterized membrane protein YdjX (TVP38/TMEM64 family)
MRAEPRPGGFGRVLPLVVVAALLGAFFALGGPRYVTLDALAENRAVLTAFVAENRVTAVVLLVAIYAALVAISFPGAGLLTLFAGFLFGTAVGGAAVVAGATLGAVVIFLISRTSLGEPLAARAGPFLEKLRGGFQDGAFSYMLVLRLVPAFPFWLVNIAAGLLGVPLRTFVVTTFLGIIPGTFVYASVGAGVGVVLDAGGEVQLGGLLLKPEILGPIAALTLLSLLPVVLKRVRGSRARAV